MQPTSPLTSRPDAVDAGNATDVGAASTAGTAADVTAVDVTAADATAADATAADVTAADVTAADVTAADVTAADVTAAGSADVAALARRQFMQRLALTGLDFPESSLGPLIAQVADLDRAAAMLRGDWSYRDEPSNIFQPAAFGGSAV